MSNLLKNEFKRIGAHFSSALHLYMSPRTSSDSIRSFVNRLVPSDLGVPLCRVGSDGDGGYLVPDDFKGIQYCFSPGVAETATFETALYHRGIKSFLADYSVAGPPSGLPECDFVKKFVGAVNSDNVMTLDRWVEEKCPDETSGDLILQMDIEGAEYETLLATSVATLTRFRIVVLELHKLNHLDNRLYFRTIEATICKLLEYFDVAHLHPNNAGGMTRIAGIEVPRVAEVTFLRKDRTVSKRPVKRLPNPLDVRNVQDERDILLPDYWWKSDGLRRSA